MSSHLSDSVLFGHLWTTPEMHALFDDTRAHPGLAGGAGRHWPPPRPGWGCCRLEAATAIAEHAHVDRLDLAAVAAGTQAAGHSTLGVDSGTASGAAGRRAGSGVYYGATVQDVTDTWTARTMATVLDILDRDVERCRRGALELARTHRDTIMCGRTHGQPGLPITFGFKAAVWADELGRHLERIAQARARVAVAQLGGALGTMEFWGNGAPELLAMRSLGGPVWRSRRSPGSPRAIGQGPSSPRCWRW